MPLPIYLMSNFPSVRPSLNLQFDSQPTPADMTSHLASVGATFSRASIGTYTDANGLIQEATAGQARPNYSSAGVHEGLLIEESRTNLVKSSEDFSTNFWTNNDDTVINQAIAPNGEASADLPNNVYPASGIGDATTIHTASVFAKTYSSNTSLVFRMNRYGSGADYVQATFNLSAGTVGAVTENGTASSGSVSIEDYGDGWYRCILTGITSTTSGTISVNPQSQVYLWGAQLEAGSFPTSYIPTIPTFSERDSVATFLGSDGLIQTASVDVARSDTYVYVDNVLTEAGLLLEGSAENLITSSENFSEHLSDTLINVIPLENQAIAPDGKASAEKIVADTTDGAHIYVQGRISRTGTFVQSIFAKADEYDYLYIKPLSGVISTSNNVVFNVSNGTVHDAGTYSEGYGIEDYGNGWYRCYVVVTNPNRTQFGVSNLANASNDDLSFAGDGESGVLVWGFQEEAGSQPTSYFPTERTFTSRASTATFFNASGVLSTASNNVARTDHKYIGGEWVEAGLLLEGASDNIVLQSEDFSTTWSTANTSVTTNQISAPDGQTTADLISAQSASSATSIYQNITTASGVNRYVFSVFAKAGTIDKLVILLNNSVDPSSGDGYQRFDISNQTLDISARVDNAGIIDVGNGWYRCFASFDIDTTSSQFRIYPDNLFSSSIQGDETIYLWGAQAELGDYPTSYIPTTTATATRSADVSSAKSSADRTRDADSYTTATKVRSADVCYIDGTAFSDFYNEDEGTMLSEFYWNGLERNINAKLYMFVDDVGTNAIFSDMPENQLVIAVDGVLQVNINGTDLTAETNNKSVSAFKVNDAVLYTNGSQVGTDSSLAIPTVLKLKIGVDQSNINSLNGAIKKLIYFPRRLSNNELIKLTQ